MMMKMVATQILTCGQCGAEWSAPEYESLNVCPRCRHDPDLVWSSLEIDRYSCDLLSDGDARQECKEFEKEEEDDQSD